MKPTPTALQLCETATPHVVALDEAVAAIRTGGATTLRIGYIAPAVISLVPKLVDVVRSHNPGTHIELHTLSTPDLLDQINGGAIDLGFALAVDPPPAASSPPPERRCTISLR